MQLNRYSGFVSFPISYVFLYVQLHSRCVTYSTLCPVIFPSFSRDLHRERKLITDQLKYTDSWEHVDAFNRSIKRPLNVFGRRLKIAPTDTFSFVNSRKAILEQFDGDKFDGRKFVRTNVFPLSLIAHYP